MKIPKSIRNGYNEQLGLYKILKEKVDNIIRGKIEREWHYLSRIKELESYNLKIETGRYSNSSLLDDFFACTLVVENINSIGRAESLINSLFSDLVRRPVSSRKTHKRSDSFPFDDLRIYAKWKDAEELKPTGLNGLVFEIQIKTFLQHAWGIATHDLVYKSDSKNWAKERVAYQIKAMLEHAEMSISEVDKLAESSALNKCDSSTLKTNKIIKILDDIWESDDLPKDKKRLAETVQSLLDSIDLKPVELRTYLEKEMAEGRGARLLNLSPYAIIVQSLLNRIPEKMEALFRRSDSKFKLYIPDELDVPDRFDVKGDNSVIVNFFSKQ